MPTETLQWPISLAARDCCTFCPIEGILNKEIINTNNIIDFKKPPCNVAHSLSITKLPVQALNPAPYRMIPVPFCNIWLAHRQICMLEVFTRVSVQLYYLLVLCISSRSFSAPVFCKCNYLEYRLQARGFCQKAKHFRKQLLPLRSKAAMTTRCCMERLTRHSAMVTIMFLKLRT